MKYLISFIFFVSAQVIADGSSIESELDVIHFWQGHSDAFLFSQKTMVNPDDCPKPNSWYALSKSHPHYQEIYSLLLMAKAPNLKVKINLSGCYAGAYPLVRDVYL